MNCSPPGSLVHGISPGNNMGVGSCSLLLGIFPTHRSNPGLLHCRWILHHLSDQRSPYNHEDVPLYRLTVSVQFSSVTQSCPTLCNPMNRSMPGLPVHHQLLEFTQTHIHRVSDAIQPSHPLLSPSPLAPNPSQHHSLFQ